MPSQMTVIFAGGGTGGHIYPLYGLHQILAEAGISYHELFVGVRGRVDADLYRSLGVAHHLQSLGRSTGGWRKILLLVRVAMYALYWLFALPQKAIVVTTGGFASVPVVLAARFRRIETVWYEPNAVDGRVTRRLSGTSTVVRPFIDGAPALLRSELYKFKAAELASHQGIILIMGGSQGSVSLNRLLLQQLSVLIESGREVVWITGEYGHAQVCQALEGNQKLPADRFEILSYCDQMQQMYLRADIVICRSGASSVFEAAAAGVPALYVPLPWSADSHQEKNALSAAQKGWGMMCPEDEFDASFRQVFSLSLKLKSEDFYRPPSLELAKDYYLSLMRPKMEAVCA